MTKVIVVLGTTPTRFPAGTASTGISVKIEGLPTQVTTGAPYTVTFDDVPPGIHTAIAQAIDEHGAAIGAAITSESFTITEPDVTIELPASITVTVQ